MAALKFEKDSDDNDTKTALSMYSKDGEMVELSSATDCTGQVMPDLISLCVYFHRFIYLIFKHNKILRSTGFTQHDDLNPASKNAGNWFVNKNG